jgi:hypothetical protein
MQVSGTIKVGETTSQVGKAARRHVGGSASLDLLLYVAFLAIFAGAGVAIYWGIAQWLGFTDKMMPTAAGISGGLGVFIWVRLLRRMMVARYRKSFVKAELPTDLPLTIEMRPDALVYKLGLIEHRIEWRAVTEVFPLSEYWLVLAQGSTFFVPRRVFSDASAQRAFVAEALAHMTGKARKRSAKAETFVSAKAA